MEADCSLSTANCSVASVDCCPSATSCLLESQSVTSPDSVDWSPPPGRRSADSDASVRLMRDQDPPQFYTVVKMHLSFLLNLSVDEVDAPAMLNGKPCDSAKKRRPLASRSRSKSKSSGGSEGIVLSHEGVCQVYQLIDFLNREQNLVQEGLFRKTGNLSRQQELRRRLLAGESLDFDSGAYTAHDCASVLKLYLAGLTEPLLTDALFAAHCQVLTLTPAARQLKAQQLLLLLLPAAHRRLLADLLPLLHRVTRRHAQNRMTALSLGTLLAPHLLCPRRMPAAELQTNADRLARTAALLIEQAPLLFQVPDELALDARAYAERMEAAAGAATEGGSSFGKGGSRRRRHSCSDATQSPQVSTVFTFVDREQTAAAAQGTDTDTALADLYAHVGSMPDSNRRRKLIKQFNRQSGAGTPTVTTRARTRSFGQSLRKHLPFGGDRKQRRPEVLPSRSTSEEILASPASPQVAPRAVYRRTEEGGVVSMWPTPSATAEMPPIKRALLTPTAARHTPRLARSLKQVQREGVTRGAAAPLPGAARRSAHTAEMSTFRAGRNASSRRGSVALRATPDVASPTPQQQSSHQTQRHAYTKNHPPHARANAQLHPLSSGPARQPPATGPARPSPATSRRNPSHPSPGTSRRRGAGEAQPSPISGRLASCGSGARLQLLTPGSRHAVCLRSRSALPATSTSASTISTTKDSAPSETATDVSSVGESGSVSAGVVTEGFVSTCCGVTTAAATGSTTIVTSEDVPFSAGDPSTASVACTGVSSAMDSLAVATDAPLASAATTAPTASDCLPACAPGESASSSAVSSASVRGVSSTVTVSSGTVDGTDGFYTSDDTAASIAVGAAGSASAAPVTVERTGSGQSASTDADTNDNQTAHECMDIDSVSTEETAVQQPGLNEKNKSINPVTAAPANTSIQHVASSIISEGGALSSPFRRYLSRRGIVTEGLASPAVSEDGDRTNRGSMVVESPAVEPGSLDRLLAGDGTLSDSLLECLDGATLHVGTPVRAAAAADDATSAPEPSSGMPEKVDPTSGDPSIANRPPLMDISNQSVPTVCVTDKSEGGVMEEHQSQKTFGGSDRSAGSHNTLKTSGAPDQQWFDAAATLPTAPADPDADTCGEVPRRKTLTDRETNPLAQQHRRRIGAPRSRRSVLFETDL